MNAILDTVLANTDATIGASRAATRGRDLIKTVSIGSSFNGGARTGWGPTGSAWKNMSDADIDFPVAERALFAQGRTEDGIACPDHKAIVRSYRGAPAVLGVVGADYKVLHTGEAVESMLDALDRALPASAFEGAMRRDLASYKGAVTACEVVLPALGGDVVTNTGFRSRAGFRIILRNSYDGSGSTRLMSGMIDFFCTNGAISGDYDVAAFRHTKGLKVERLVAQVEKSVERFQRDMLRIKTWAQNDVERPLVEEALKNLPGMSERKAARLLQAFDREVATRGPSFWSLMSALTADATHGAVRDTGNDHAAATILDRQVQAARWTETLAQVLEMPGVGGA
jgi:hypothetical protein